MGIVFRKKTAPTGWVREAGRGKTTHGWKGVRPGVRLESQTVRAGEEPEEHKRIFMSTFNDISWRSKDVKKSESSAQPVSHYAKRFLAGQWLFLGPGSEKKWSSTNEDSPQGEWDRIAEQMMLPFAESKPPVFRSTSPLSRGVLKSKGGGNFSIHYCADTETIESVNQLSYLCKSGAVSDLCEECKTCHVRTGRPVVAGQSDHCSCLV